MFHKMSFKQYLFLLLFVLIRTNTSQEIMSTTQKPSNQLYNSPEAKENNYRLLALELQNAQFQKSMEKQCKLDEEKLGSSLATLQSNITAICKTKLDNIEKQTSKVKDLSACSRNLLNETTQQIVAKIEKVQGELLSQFEAKLHKMEKDPSACTSNLLNETTQQIVAKIEKKQEELLNQFEAKLQKMEERITAKISKIMEDELQAKLKQINKIQEPAKNCVEYQKAGRNSGVYSLKSATGVLYSVYCDMETKGGGWIQILSRFDGSVNFDVNWIAYKDGFGKPSKEFWLGLEHLYQLTHSEDYELLVNLVDWDNKKVYASYTKFEIGSENEGYPLKVISGYTGDAGDGLSPLQAMKFSAKDKDSDGASGTNCATSYKGGWWYKSCYTLGSKLTGVYLKTTSKSFTGDGIHWLTLHHGSMKEAKMMIRPRKRI